MDTSAWYAIIDKNDRDHPTAITKTQNLDRPLVTSNYVLEERPWGIFEQYEDKGFSFTDCTSFALMERLEINTAFVFDDHFVQYGKFVIL